MQKLTIPFSWGLYWSFSLLSYLTGAAHELAHHLTGFLGSGEFGRVSFVLFIASSADAHPVATSLAGPVVTFVVAWVGAIWLIRGKNQLWAMALIAASHSFMRLVSVVGRGGDESVAARALFGYLPYWQMLVAESLLVLPPLVIAYISIANRRRPLVYLAYVIGPFLPLIAFKFVDDRWFATFVSAPESFHHPVWVGIPAAIVVTHVFVLTLFLITGVAPLRRHGLEIHSATARP